jgi:hypothetical protein
MRIPDDNSAGALPEPNMDEEEKDKGTDVFITVFS